VYAYLAYNSESERMELFKVSILKEQF
jgi:hypothetical protein